ncbi:MAG: hypothetical protein SFW62_08925 [Alphaproteobacteria bacterium]|nr:hypothetical protein [Alphaproteobacteria bacterium]
MPTDNKTWSYQTTMLSDLKRDGMCLELTKVNQADEVVMLYEIFYSDVDHTMTFQSFSDEAIPLDVIESFVKASSRLIPQSKIRPS